MFPELFLIRIVYGLSIVYNYGLSYTEGNINKASHTLSVTPLQNWVIKKNNFSWSHPINSLNASVYRNQPID